jgi:hypothetical protein
VVAGKCFPCYSCLQATFGDGWRISSQPMIDHGIGIEDINKITIIIDWEAQYTHNYTNHTTNQHHNLVSLTICNPTKTTSVQLGFTFESVLYKNRNLTTKAKNKKVPRRAAVTSSTSSVAVSVPHLCAALLYFSRIFTYSNRCVCLYCWSRNTVSLRLPEAESQSAESTTTSAFCEVNPSKNPVRLNLSL